MYNTIGELITALEINLDKYLSPSYDNDEYVVFFNLATAEFIKSRYDEFDLSQRRIDDLRHLVRQVTLPVVSGVALLPVDYEFALSVRVNVSYSSCGDTLLGYFSSIPLKLDALSIYPRDPFNRPSYNFPKHQLRQESMLLYLGDNSNGATAVDVELHYLSRIQQLTLNANGGFVYPPLNTILSFNCWDEVLQMMTRKVLENIEQPRRQTYLSEIELHQQIRQQ